MAASAAEDVTAALVGQRRACQFLRLLDLGRVQEGSAILWPLQPRELTFVAAALQAEARTSARGLTAEQRALQQTMAADLNDQMQQVASVTDIHRWVNACAVEALRVLRAAQPRQADRIHYLELSARRAFDDEDPGSLVREAIFGEHHGGRQPRAGSAA